MNFYECSICLSLNHASRLHCQNCGTIPAMYSLLRAPAHLVESDDYWHFVLVVRAFGAESASQRQACRSYLRTVPLTYYAQPSAD
jgi:hypothetical protein